MRSTETQLNCPRVSVIVPVYNAGDHLRECLDSVLGQTLREIEVICVDDGSTDDSPCILKAYASDDVRVRIVCQSNAGAGVARNHGLEVAAGETVVFMDPDDYYPDSQSLEKLYSQLQSSGCSVAGGRLMCVPVSLPRARGIQASWNDWGRFPSPGLHEYSDWQAPWGYTCFIYRMDMLRQSGARFAECRRFQDPPFFVTVMHAARKFFSFDSCVYCYRIREKAIDWTADGGRMAKERHEGYRATRRLADEYGLKRLSFLIGLWQGREKLGWFRQKLCAWCETGNSVVMAPSELEVHDYFDDCRRRRHMDDSLFRLLRRIFSAPATAAKSLLPIVAERLVLAKETRRIGFRRFSLRRKILVLLLLSRGYAVRRRRMLANVINRFRICLLPNELQMGKRAEIPYPCVDGRSVSVVIPVYDGFEALVRLCGTLFAHTERCHEIIFVNDASVDSRVLPYLDGLAHTHANVRVLTNDANLGFPGSVNVGASTCNRDFVILNTDTEVPQGWISRLFAPIWECPGTASAMPLTNEWAGNMVSNPGVVPISQAERLGVQKIDSAVSGLIPDHRWDLTRNSLGFCMAISREAWNKVGGLDAKVFGKGYSEETDWCARARYCFGFEHRVAQNLFVAHWHGGSFSDEQRREQMDRNRERIRSRNPLIFAENNPMYSACMALTVRSAKNCLKGVLSE